MMKFLLSDTLEMSFHAEAFSLVISGCVDVFESKYINTAAINPTGFGRLAWISSVFLPFKKAVFPATAAKYSPIGERWDSVH